MTKWKQRRREREQLVRDFAIAAIPVFLSMVLDKSIKLNASQQQAEELRVIAADCAWAHGEMMVKTKP